MRDLRHLVVWLILLALPLQAISAVSMRVCSTSMDMPVNPDATQAMARAAQMDRVLPPPAHAMDGRLPAPAAYATEGGPQPGWSCGVSAACQPVALETGPRLDQVPRRNFAPAQVSDPLRTRAAPLPKKPPRN